MVNDASRIYSELTRARNLENKLTENAMRIMGKSQDMVSRANDLLKPYKTAVGQKPKGDYGSIASYKGNAVQTKASPVYTPGSRIANTASYNNDAAKGQCVWYVRGRAKEKLGVDPGAIGNANQMYYNAKDSAKVTASTENIKPNMLVSYNKGTSSGGQTYGHVIYIEDVVGDTVYYTEGGSGYYKNGTDGVVKTATRQGIINGVNSSGGRMGSEVLGFIDLSKY